MEDSEGKAGCCLETTDLIRYRGFQTTKGEAMSSDQIADLLDSYLAVDNLEAGRRNRIPLYLFGFLY